jgi:serine/threonine-protein kinase
MGEVYAGFDDTLHRRVALKAIRAEHRLNDVAKARFLREARILSQLDHPGVCRVYDFIETEASDWLVLELIEGKTLQQALTIGIDGPPRMAIAAQLADVLVASHRAGIVHRDLKPGNIMLTAGDAVKVLDFGLAQSGESNPEMPAPGALAVGPGTSAPRDIAATRTFAAAREHRTQAGIVMGTPAYMSPEQARGEPATPASDMFALGLILQELFSGEPAYAPGTDVSTVLEQARRGETREARGLPAALGALIARLKSPSAAARPTAVEAADALRWIRDTPRRRLRRLAAAALVLLALGGAARYTIDLTRERTKAVAARDEADRRRSQAEDLIGFMLGDLRQKLEPVGRLDVLDGVGAKAMDYFAAVAPEALSDEELLRRSTALYQIGEVRIAQGNLPAARQPLEESLALAQALVARDPRDGDRLFGLAQSQYWVGFVHWRRHELDEAQRLFEAYLETARRLVALDAGRADWQREIAYASSNIGTVLQSRGQLDGALARFRECLAIERGLLAAVPTDQELARAVASSHNAIGLVQRQRGRLDDAVEEFGAERAMLERLAAGAPANTRIQARLIVSYSYLGDLLRARGRTADARQRWEDALRIATALAARDATNRTWQRELARVHFKMGLSRIDDAPRQAMSAFDTALDILRVLVAADPTNPPWQRDLAETRYARGEARADLGDVGGAADDAEATVSMATTLLKASAGDREAARLLSLGYALQARVWQARGDALRARAAWEQSLAAISPVARESDDYQFLDPLALALLETGRTDEAAGIIRKLQAMQYHNPRLFAAVRTG